MGILQDEHEKQKVKFSIKNTIKKHLEAKKSHLESGDKGCSGKTLMQNSCGGCKRQILQQNRFAEK